MLIDIFARRYETTKIFETFQQRDTRLLIQAFRIISEDMYPYYHGGKEDAQNVSFWTNLHNRLSRELGINELSKQWFPYKTNWNGNEQWKSAKHPMVTVCKNWMEEPVNGSADQHLKERLSLIELAFRERENEVGYLNDLPTIVSTIATPPRSIASTHMPSIPMPGNRDEVLQSLRQRRIERFKLQQDELNARFRQAEYGLHYHNGFIQFLTDSVLQDTVESPFWALLDDPKWVNVDLDMKEALDLRDSDGRDPAFYAARALESAIKIISNTRGWTHGKENGAHNFIDNLGSKANGFIEGWEAKSLKGYFTDVRNPIGHGAGSEKMPTLTRQQTEWAIEFSMSWIKSLIRRL